MVLLLSLVPFFSPKIKYDVPASCEFLPELCIDNVTVSETEIMYYPRIVYGYGLSWMLFSTTFNPGVTEENFPGFRLEIN